MNKSVILYLVSVINEGNAFWLVNFAEEEDIYNSLGSNLLECYRKELFGLEGAIEVKDAINSTLDILAFDTKFDRYKLDNSNTGYSSEIPIDLIEDIFDLWVDNYHNKSMWKKYIGILKFRKKFKVINFNYINRGLKGATYEFAIKLDKLLSFNPGDLLYRNNQSNDSMW